MPGSTQTGEPDNARIMLGLLESVERDGARSQRRLAAELDIGLGLVNAALKRCIQKGLIKVTQATARRFAYYLTPQGFAEKSRLPVEYPKCSFTFSRKAKSDLPRRLRRGAPARIPAGRPGRLVRPRRDCDHLRARERCRDRDRHRSAVLSPNSSAFLSCRVTTRSGPRPCARATPEPPRQAEKAAS
jgi:hypothetical protein